MLFQLAPNLVHQQIDHGVKILGLLLRDDGEAPGFDSNFTVLPEFVNREDQMSLAGALEQLAEMREFALRVQANRVGGLDVPERHGHVSLIPIGDPRSAPHFSIFGTGPFS